MSWYAITMIKVILFDADGVLISGKPFSQQLEKDFGIKVANLQPFFREKFPACLVGKADLKEEIKPYLPTWGWSGTTDDLLRYWFRVEHEPNQGLLLFIKRLKENGYKVYVATNQEKYRTEYLRNEMGFGSQFDGIFSSSYIGHKKPEQDFFKKILNEVKPVKANEVLFWDDSEENIIAAKNLGFEAHLYQNFSDFQSKMKKLLNSN